MTLTLLVETTVATSLGQRGSYGMMAVSASLADRIIDSRHEPLLVHLSAISV
jgi:hypothetical protein